MNQPKKPREIIKEVKFKRAGVTIDTPLTPDEIEHCMRLWHIQETAREAELKRKNRTMDELWKQPLVTHDDLEINLNLVKEAANYTADFKTCCTAPNPSYHDAEEFFSIYRCLNCKQAVMQYNSGHSADVPYAVYAEPTADKPLLPIREIMDFKDFCMAWRHLAKTDPTIVPFENEFQAVAVYITQLRKNQNG